jgi:hypothetical protein
MLTELGIVEALKDRETRPTEDATRRNGVALS